MSKIENNFYKRCGVCLNRNTSRCGTCIPENPRFEPKSDVQVIVDEISRLKDELDVDKAAAVQWVTYDGRKETLPRAAEPVLVWLNELPRLKHPAFIARAVAVYTIPAWQRGDDNPELQIKHGDRWAYLPTPPEGGKNEIL